MTYTSNQTYKTYRALGVLLALAMLAPLGASAAVTTVTDRPDFQAPLTNSLELKSGVGKPTFTRATTAYQTDFEGKLNSVLSGEARFQGARRVRNLAPINLSLYTGPTPTSGVSDPVGGTSAYTITSTGAGSQEFYFITNSSTQVGAKVLNSYYIRYRAGATTIRIGDGDANYTYVNITGTWQRFVAPISTSAGGNSYVAIRFASAGDSIDMWHVQQEVVTGQTNQNPSEYVSCGVMSAPYHGAGVDCVQYFNTLNGNTVASNVVTETKGAPIASGECTGGTITHVGGNTIHTFTSSGTLACSTPKSTSYLVVAGGGSGGSNDINTGGAGGGAGGMRTGTLSITSGTKTVTVGAGGTAPADNTSGNNGGDSVFDSITSTGGGGGAKGLSQTVGLNGGSGGGGAYTTGGTGIAGQGNNGGTGPSTGGTTPHGAGGGGAGAAGGPPIGAVAGAGGIGLSSSISGTATYYAGGGGAATESLGDSDRGLGGLGGGGDGGIPNGSAGTANTGGGGGGGRFQGQGVGGAGGSGIVIVSYPTPTSAASGGATAGVVDSIGPLGYLAEGARTNAVTYSNGFSNWDVHYNATVAQNQTDPSGVANSFWTMTDTSAATIDVVFNTVTVPNDSSAWTNSAYFKKTSGATSFPAIEIDFIGGSNAYYEAVINTNAGTAVMVGGTGFAGGTTTVHDAGGFWRVEITGSNDSSGNTSMRPAIRPAVNTDASATYNAATTGSIIVGWAQSENAAFASSYIPTTTGALARNADALSYVSAGNVNNTAGTASAEFTGQNVGGQADVIGSTVGSPIMLGWSTNQVALYDGAGIRYLSSLAFSPSVQRVAVSWGGSASNGFINGAIGGISPAAFDGNMNMSANMGIGTETSNVVPLWGTVRNVQIWKKALPNATLTNLTSSTNAVAQTATKQAVATNNDPSFQADLANTLDIQRGLGKPTFTRATTAYQTDFEGKLNQAISGEARFQGARRVQQLSTVDDLTTWTKIGTPTIVAGATDPNGGATAFTVTAGPTGNEQIWKATAVVNSASNTSCRDSIWVRRRSGTGAVYIYTANGNATDITSSLTSTWQRFSSAVVTVNAGNGAANGIVMAGNGDQVDIWHPLTENVSGQANQNPSEYVSGTETTAGAAGVHYFNTLNGNTVSSNVVTERTGAKITSAAAAAAGGVTVGVVDSTGPLGYLAEGARTNIVPHSDLDSGWSTNTGATITPNSSVGLNGLTTMAKLQTVAGTGNHDGYILSTKSSTLLTVSAIAKAGTAHWFGLSFDGGPQVDGAFFDLTNGVVGTISAGATATIVNKGNGFYLCTVTRTLVTGTHYIDIFVATSDNQPLTWNAAGTEYLYVGMAQEEENSFASSYVPTTTGSAARNADVLTYPTAGNTNNAFGTWYAEITAADTQNTVRQTVIGRNADTTGLFANNLASKVAYADSVSLTNMNPLSFTSASTPVRIGLIFGNSFATGALSGLLSTPIAFTNSANLGANMSIGTSNSGGGALFGTLRNVKIWPKALPSSQLANMTSATAAVAQAAVKKTTINTNQNTKVTNGLVGYWPFNGTDMSGTTAYDRSGNANNGTLTGGPTVTEGRVGQALKFNGTNYIDVGNGSSLNQNVTGITMSAWIKPSALSGVQAVIGKWANSVSNDHLLFGTNGNYAIIAVGDGSVSEAGFTDDTTALSNGKWYHIVGTWSNTRAYNLYVNGNLVKSGTQTGNGINTGSNQTLKIGAQVTVLPRAFNGTIDEVRVYNRALTATEVKSLYNLGR